MATFNPPFAYNPGAPISGTTQYDDLVVGNVDIDYSTNYGGVQWWASPEEVSGYIIGNARPGGQPTPSGATGTAQVGFFRSKGRTDQAFLDLANYIGAKNGQPTFTTTNQAEVWLESNGYYTSFNLPTPTPTSTPAITPTRTLTPTPTPTVTPSNTPYPPGAYQFYRTEGLNAIAPTYNGGIMLVSSGDLVTYNPNDSFEIVFTAIDKSGTSHPEYDDLLLYGGTITLTQGANTYIASGESGFFSYITSTFNYYAASYLDVIQLSANPFVSGSPIFLTASVNYPPTPTPTATNTPTLTRTPTPTPTPGGGWFFFFANGATVTRAPNNNGETVFYDGLGKSVYNPNYTGGTLNLSFNNINTAGTSYESQFSTLDTAGGTITISQGSSTVIYSGTSTDYVGTASLVRLVVTRSAQMIQSASTQFVSGTSINVVVN